MKHLYIIMGQKAIDAVENGLEVTNTLCLEDIVVHVRSSESFYSDEAKAEWVKNGRYISPPKEIIWKPWDKLI